MSNSRSFEFNEQQSREMEEKAAAVKSALGKSPEHILEAAKLVQWAFDNYKESTLDRFLTLAGISPSIASKLRRIANCEALYRPRTKEVLNRIGWSMLNEL